MSDGHQLKKDDLLRIITSGGGGWGSPLERPAEHVRDDVLDGFVSIESAYADYGVVLSTDGAMLDADATEARRTALAGPRGMFHRDGFFDGANFQVEAAE